MCDLCDATSSTIMNNSHLFDVRYTFTVFGDESM